MKKLFSLKGREYLLILISVLVSIGFIFFVLGQLKKESLETVRASLETLNIASHDALNQWLNFRKKNIEELVRNRKVVEYSLKLLSLERDSSVLVDSRFTDDLRNFFYPILDANEDMGVFIIAPDYISIFSMRNANTGSVNVMSVERKDLLERVFNEGKTVLVPPIRSDVPLKSRYGGKTMYTMFLLAPVVYEGKIIAAFSLRIDIRKNFSRILELGNIGETGETFGFDNMFRLVTRSRFEKQLDSIRKGHMGSNMLTLSPLVKSAGSIGLIDRVKSDPTRRIMFNKLKDCRNKDIFGVLTWDDDLNIGIITKIDRDEALKGYFFVRRTLVILFCLIGLVAFFIINFIINIRQKSEDVLQIANAKLEDKVSERTVELKETIKTKDKFFSILAHDLRSPFNGLLGLFDLLLNDPKAISEEEKRNILQSIYDSSKNLYNLLENLLMWSRTQTNRVELHPESIDLKSLIDADISILREQAGNKRISLVNDISVDTVVFADRNTMDTVFRNLISNAIKFTPEEGKVTVGFSHMGKKIRITVSDNGIGISKEKMAKLFKLDEKVSTSGTNNESGTGLGLILCKDFVELNNGRIFVESEIGKGSRFIVELPHP
ncbi:MAG: HAMP domain-containing histidine kinase [Bacteroidales bacterium]|jgi:signal transduction histidine kinase|nr:HAMP domain-containing histidine kinase [Bacteroidales bacterium]